MTTTSKPVRRETLSSVRVRRASRPLVIELHATFVKIRPKGMRTAFVATYDQIFNTGARNAAEQARKERAAARAARKGQR